MYGSLLFFQERLVMIAGSWYKTIILVCGSSCLPGLPVGTLCGQVRKRYPKGDAKEIKIHKIKDFLLTARRNDAHFVKIKRSKDVVKFKVRPLQVQPVPPNSAPAFTHRNSDIGKRKLESPASGMATGEEHVAAPAVEDTLEKKQASTTELPAPSGWTKKGVPMFYMGDEYGHTKGGNNNTYCHDHYVNYFCWDKKEEQSSDLYRFCRLMTKFRK
ncbi:glycogen debranching enzyme [Zea mays]|uniref:glycogen debranching enzyme n=1 Tax=Zea mays TaxID=4577 RepID=UPI0009AA4A6A|nr:glycogen debranching enzyme [Zea mays]|eukprot:XP_020407452.1 uncharacterized protein LOC103653536 [Zea mays]